MGVLVQLKLHDARGHEPDLDVAAKTYAGISRHSTLAPTVTACLSQ